jgi:hypothetical protein
MFIKDKKKLTIGLVIVLLLVVAARIASFVVLKSSDEYAFALDWLSKQPMVIEVFGNNPEFSLDSSGFNFGFAGDVSFKDMTISINGNSKSGKSKVGIRKVGVGAMRMEEARIVIGRDTYDLKK